MPELLEGYDRACALVGDGPLDHCILSHYRSAQGRVDHVWPGAVRPQSFGRFATGEYAHELGELV
jgi:hypothetical protein